MVAKVPIRVRSYKTPSIARYSLVAVCWCWFSMSVLASETEASTFTEQEVVARALARAPLLDAIEGEVAIEEGKGRAASAYMNPQVFYLREQTFGSNGTGEDYLSIAQTIDLGRRRSFRRQASEARVRAARHEGDATRLSMTADARLRFYEVLYRQARVAALENWVLRIDAALQIVARRESQGDAAAYDRRRLERERAVAIGRRKSESATLERARARLRALLGPDVGAPRATGQLLPPGDPADTSFLRQSSVARPDLLALESQVGAAALDRKATLRWWLPDLRLEGGWKGVGLNGGQGRTDGFLFGASLSVPLWDRSQGLARAAEGEAQAVRGRHALLEAELEGELEGLRAEAVQLRQAATELREETSAASSDLVRMSSVGYEGGELGLLELLDAYRGSAEDVLEVLEVEHAARRASIELERLTGAERP